MIRIMIADDDKHMRFVLKKALDKVEDIQIVAEATTGHEAVGLLEAQAIDVAFLDIDMPGLDGIETAKLILDIRPRCKIIFVTAHEHYMSQAFELYAYDYIIKPFKLERLHKTINRIKELMENTWQSDIPKKVHQHELLFKLKDGMVLLKPEDIILVERENRSTVIITDKAKYVTNKTLKEMEHILPEDDFIRSHKSYILRIDKISTISIYGRWTYIVKFKNCDIDALLTKEKASELEKRFGIGNQED
ncbi:LytR/AlgR family response regulator transcription factor [Vallitalea pronyensis]|uniref:LytR/AlgR family response regulator transcription factor n=1 Tax=Vallitalea pronyensis TaxID=1348613 RepID=UPI001FEC5BF3|nr:LytTR family DNA-binding domain-containing protein [Vallitalea pronyensis]